MMRQPRPKEKLRQKVPLLEDLIEFLRYAHEQIERGEDDATIPSDDLLQCERAYGGLIEEGGDYFQFTYFPEPGIRHQWILTLHRSDIEMIADGAFSELNLWACQTPDCRCKFSKKQDTCSYCHYEDV